MKRPVKRACVASELSLYLRSASIDGNGGLLLLDSLFDFLGSFEFSPKARSRCLTVGTFFVLLLAFVAGVCQQ